MSGRFESIAERHLEVVIHGNPECMCRCPFCDGSSSLQFNLDTGLWLCFKCDEKGNAKTLVRKLGGTYTDPAISVDAIWQHLDRLKILRRDRQKEKTYDESILRRYGFPNDYWSEIRGFSNATINKWQLGYDPIKDRHIIPYRNLSGELLGVIQRLGDEEAGEVDIRYIYPKTFNRKESLFGSWHLVGLPKIGLVEGSTDVIALDDVTRPAGGQYGSSISDAQARLLHRLGVREVVLFYDYDEAGRKATEKSQEVLKGLILRQVHYNPEQYCWHEKFCGCGEHNWRTIAKCPNRKNCRCGRRHGMDPGSLRKKERRRMFDEAVLVGSKKKWQSAKFA